MVVQGACGPDERSPTFLNVKKFRGIFRKMFSDYTYTVYLIFNKLKFFFKLNRYMIYGTVLRISLLTQTLAFPGLFSPMPKGPSVLCFLGSYCLPFYHLTLLQNSQSTNYEAENPMSKPWKTSSKVHITTLWLRVLWSFLCKKQMSFAAYNL